MTNTYDKFDRVQQQSVIRAGAMKLGAYRVRDPETDEWSALQFHMTYDNTVMAMMSESAAKLFAKFVTETLMPKRTFENEDTFKDDPSVTNGDRA